MSVKKEMLGILGGMGPEATSVLYKKIIDKTEVTCDQDHINILIYSHAEIPDRTACILEGKTDYLWDVLGNDIDMLKKAGCKYLAVPCNTSHYFADKFNEKMDGNFINMIEEASKYAKKRNLKKVGVMATTGTVKSDLYKKELNKVGIEAVYPEEDIQKLVMSLIYDDIKRGGKGDRHVFKEISEAFKKMGCEAVILACTELSVFAQNYELNADYYIDAMECLSRACIEKCGGKYLD